MFRRDVFVADCPAGDFFLTSTGVSWGVRRSVGNGSAMSLLEGQPQKKRAVAALLAFAADAGTDAWETVTINEFWLIKRHRPQGQHAP